MFYCAKCYLLWEFYFYNEFCAFCYQNKCKIKYRVSSLILNPWFNTFLISFCPEICFDLLNNSDRAGYWGKNVWRNPNKISDHYLLLYEQLTVRTVKHVSRDVAISYSEAIMQQFYTSLQSHPWLSSEILQLLVTSWRVTLISSVSWINSDKKHLHIWLSFANKFDKWSETRLFKLSGNHLG